MAYTVTYGQLISRGLALIKANTWNVDSLYDNSLPAAYKSGWTNTVDKNALHVTATLSSNAVAKVTGSTVETDYNAYMTNVGMMARSSETITLNGLLQFLHYLTCFCQARLYHWTSQYANPVYIYKTGTVTYPTPPTNGSDNDLITAVDENNLGEVLGNIINSSTNIGCTHYTRSVRWTGT